jgi:hypothetical protein
MILNRRKFLQSAAALSGGTFLSTNAQQKPGPHFNPKAKKIIYLFMAGGPSQLETFDYKPKMKKMFDKDLPASIRKGQRVTNMTAGQSRFPIAPSVYNFKQYGQSGAWVSELLPKTASMVDDLAIIKSVHTDAINHDPAKTLICTGDQLPGKASLGAWLSYGLGTLNPNLPDFTVLNCSRWSGKVNVQGLYSRLWGSGFLPSKYQGVNFRSSGDPVLYLSNPQGVSREMRGKILDLSGRLNNKHLSEIGDPEIQTTVAQQQMAFRMQESIPQATNVSEEPEHIKAMYGKDVNTPGTFAYNCLMARKLVEQDVRSVQLFHRGWDHHGKLPENMKGQCQDIDQACYGLIQDLKQRGLLDETLIVWGGEFGRTIYSQGKLTTNDYGRDHHPRCFSMWMAGAGVKKGLVYGETDDFSYNIVENPVHVRDLNASILHLMGLDHHRLSFPYNGLDMRLTGVKEAHVVQDILA